MCTLTMGTMRPALRINHSLCNCSWLEEAVRFYCWGCLSKQMHCVLHQGNCSPCPSGHSSPSLDSLVSNQKANMVKELGCHFQSPRLLIIKQSLTALTTFLGDGNMWIACWICQLNHLIFRHGFNMYSAVKKKTTARSWSLVSTLLPRSLFPAGTLSG